MEDPEERRVITRVLNAFYSYKNFAYAELIEPKKLKFASLSPDEQSILSWFPLHITTLERCIEQNSIFFQKMALSVAEEWIGNSLSQAEWEEPTVADYIKVKGILKQTAREWSDEGIKEREASFNKVVSVLESQYPDIIERQHVKILIPGVGLGRLNYELVLKGFSVQGNDFSYFMLFVSNFILNQSFIANNYDLYPYIHSTSNQLSRNFQTRPVYVPDILPSKELNNFQINNPKIPVGELMSITSGSFIDLYGPVNSLQNSSTYSLDPNAMEFRGMNRGQFDVVLTVFFIDTAHNVIEYLKTIKHCLKKGTGKWVNLGPLLWHFEDSNESQVVTIPDQDGELKQVNVPMNGLELTLEDLIEIVDRFFTIETREKIENIIYAGDSRALGRWLYDCEFWTALNNK